MDDKKLNKYSQYFLSSIKKEKDMFSERTSSVNPIVAHLASMYENLRNAIEYRDEEVILRASIERMLRRLLLFGGSGKTIATSLMRELMWTQHFKETDSFEKAIKEIEEIIDFYLDLGNSISNRHKGKIAMQEVHKLMFQFMSAHIEQKLNPHPLKESMAYYIFHILQNNVHATEPDEQLKDIQLFIGICRAYAKDDLAFLQYKLFKQYFGSLTPENKETLIENFLHAYKAVKWHLAYKGRHKILSYIKRQIPPFLILEEIISNTKSDIQELLKNDEEFAKLVYETSRKKYDQIKDKVRRAIMRSVAFILLSKVILAFGVEGMYERHIYGSINWLSLSMNIAIPTSLMIVSSFTISTPARDNSERIYSRINKILYDPEPQFGKPLLVNKKNIYEKPWMTTLFSLLWLLTIVGVFSGVAYSLNRLNFHPMSQGVFIFFLAIVSYLTYRINATANLYTVENRQSLLTPIIDFFFMPVVRVGRYLTEGISQLNVLVFILDILIETPFKGIVTFFDDWFSFLHSKREEIG